MKRVDIGDSPQKSSSGTNGRVLIKELNENDVLQGRGSGSMQNTGNIKFRNLVEKLRPAYVATSSRKEKAKMISDMVQLIQSRKGRFLQRLCDKEVEELGLDANGGDHCKEQDHYVEMTDDEAAEKAKQAIRYVHYKKVPLEEERRKKRAADSDFLTSDDKTKSESAHRMEYGGNPLASTPIAATIANQLTHAQVPQSNVRAGVAFTPQLQQTDISQLLATFQTAQTALAAQFPGSIYAAPQSLVHQPSIHRDAAQQASAMQQVKSGIIPTVGSVQQQSNTLQRLASSLFPNNHAASPLLDTSANQNSNRQQLPQQQTQLNLLLQSILQQQTSSQPNSIIQTILKQQQEQQQLNSALQTLQQQQQLASAIQSLQQPQQLSSDAQFQQHLKQQKTNSILASLLSNTNTNPQVGSTLGPLATHSTPNINPTVADMGATNALISTFLSNNVAQAPSFQQTGNSNGTNGIVTTRGQQQEQQQGLVGASALQGIPGIAQNTNTLLASSSNSTQGQTIMAAANKNTAKRQKLSSDNTDDDAA